MRTARTFGTAFILLNFLNICNSFLHGIVKNDFQSGLFDSYSKQTILSRFHLIPRSKAVESDDAKQSEFRANISEKLQQSSSETAISLVEDTQTLGDELATKPLFSLIDSLDMDSVRARIFGDSAMEDPFKNISSKEDREQLQELATKLQDTMIWSNDEEKENLKKFLDEELDKREAELRALAGDLIGKEKEAVDEFLATQLTDYSDKASQILIEQYEMRARGILERMEKEKAELKEEMNRMQDLQNMLDKDVVIQIQSFRSKGVLRQSALVASIVLANQAAYQVLLLVEGRGGDPILGTIELVLVILGLYAYGFRI